VQISGACEVERFSSGQCRVVLVVGESRRTHGTVPVSVEREDALTSLCGI